MRIKGIPNLFDMIAESISNTWVTDISDETVSTYIPCYGGNDGQTRIIFTPDSLVRAGEFTRTQYFDDPSKPSACIETNSVRHGPEAIDVTTGIASPFSRDVFNTLWNRVITLKGEPEHYKKK